MREWFKLPSGVQQGGQDAVLGQLHPLLSPAAEPLFGERLKAADAQKARKA